MADVWEEDEESSELKIAETESSKNEDDMTKVMILLSTLSSQIKPWSKWTVFNQA